jgi:hypothetical protein
MQMAVLKNELGELAEMAFSWNGKRGEIDEMDDFQRQDFDEMLRVKEEARAGGRNNGGLNF